MPIKVFKIVKAVTQLVAVALGFYVIAEGGDPTLTFGGVVMLLTGPEALEYYLANTPPFEPPNRED